MAIVKNLTNRRPLSVWGTKLRPGQADEVNASEAKIRKHPFAREGWIDVMATSMEASSDDKAPNAQELVAQIKEMGEEDVARLEELMEDSRSTVSGAAQKRYAEIAGDSGEDSESDDDSEGDGESEGE